MTRLLVIAKAPVPGRVKTRLSPPCTYEEAACIAQAALRDTLDAMINVPGAEPVVALDGEPGPWLPTGVSVLPQRGLGLGARIANALTDAGGPAVLIGMDTPQVSVRVLDHAVRTLEMPGVDSVLGLATDGGWWAIGFKQPTPSAFDGVPMSTSMTGAAQRRRLNELGLRTAPLPNLQDVDTFADAIAVASDIPGSRFARAVRASARSLEPTPAYAWQSAR